MKTMFNSFSTWITLLMLVIFSTMVIISLGYPPGARFMPLVVGIPAILMCLLQLVIDWFGSHKTEIGAHFHSEPRAGQHHLDEYPAGEHEHLADAASPEEEFGPETVGAEITIWVYFLSYMVAVLLFGFVLSVPVMVAIYLWREADVRLPYAILAGLICTTVMHLMFETLLQFQLHPGFLTGDLLHLIGL